MRSTLLSCIGLFLAAPLAFATGPNLMRGPSLTSPLSYVPSDPPGRFFPGKYFEYKAQFYLRKGDNSEALRLYELAGFWANKIAQYNVGLMYFEGIGIPEDRVTGAAWLGIAAESHDDLAESARNVAYGSLSANERAQADALLRELDTKYGDKVAVKRAVKQYVAESHNATGSHVGFIDNLSVSEAGPGGAGDTRGGEFYRTQEKEIDELVAKIKGHVTVGGVQTLPVSKSIQRIPAATEPKL